MYEDVFRPAVKRVDSRHRQPARFLNQSVVRPLIACRAAKFAFDAFILPPLSLGRSVIEQLLEKLVPLKQHPAIVDHVELGSRDRLIRFPFEKRFGAAHTLLDEKRDTLGGMHVLLILGEHAHTELLMLDQKGLAVEIDRD